MLAHEDAYRGGAVLRRIKDLSTVICGVGAIGGNLAETLARQGWQNLVLIDGDRVSQDNLGTQPYGRRQVGQLKSDALVNRLHDELQIISLSVNKRLTEQNHKNRLKYSNPELIIDAFDNTESRAIIYRYAFETGIPCLHAGMSSDGCAEVIWNERYTVPQQVGEDVCDYPLARNLVMLTVTVAAETLMRYVATGEKRSYTITLNDLKVLEL